MAHVAVDVAARAETNASRHILLYYKIFPRSNKTKLAEPPPRMRQPAHASPAHASPARPIPFRTNKKRRKLIPKLLQAPPVSASISENNYYLIYFRPNSFHLLRRPPRPPSPPPATLSSSETEHPSPSLTSLASHAPLLVPHLPAPFVVKSIKSSL